MKRKYAKDVSDIKYSPRVESYILWDKKNTGLFPVRIVRESFYRKLIKHWEEWPLNPEPHKMGGSLE